VGLATSRSWGYEVVEIVGDRAHRCAGIATCTLIARRHVMYVAADHVLRDLHLCRLHAPAESRLYDGLVAA